MFSTQEFFIKKPYTPFGDHAPKIAEWLLRKFRGKYPKLDNAIKYRKFDTDDFMKEWGAYLRVLNAETLKACWRHIDQNLNNNLYAPNLAQFKVIATHNWRMINNSKADHESAIAIGAAIAGCYCDQCQEFRQKSTVELR